MNGQSPDELPPAGGTPDVPAESEEPAAESKESAGPGAGGATSEQAPQGGGNAVRKLFGGSYTATATVGFVLFFLPWMNLSCVEVTTTYQTGYDMMAGTYTANENASEELRAKLEATLKEAGKDASNLEQKLKEQRRKQSDRQPSEITKVIWLALYPVGMLLVAFFGPIVVLANRPVRPFVPLVGAVFASVTILGTLIYQFPIERQFDAMIGETGGDRGFLMYFDLYEAPAYRYAVLLTFGTLGLVGLHYLYELVVARSRAAPG